ncbi:MAG TPA: hypothetical protein DCF49_05835 [Lachnospiraceae bacterium]|nr:hypothetical protein [Lachnospiraceae bacterium]
MRVRGTVPLTHGQEVEYKMFGFFKREEDETAIIRKVYQGMNQEYVRQLFYGGDKKAFMVLQPLWKILYPDSPKMKRKEAEEAAFFYTQVWFRKHEGSVPFSTTNYIKDRLEKRFPQYSARSIDEGVDCCVRFMYENEPELEEKDRQIIKESGFKNVGENGQPLIMRSAQTPDGYVPIDEIAKEDPYMGLYLTAEMLFEESRFPEAISVFEKCIEMQPERTNAWFEKAEALIRLRNYSAAMQTLRSTAKYAKKDQDIARLYRRIGFIRIEERSYDDAIACMLYSLQFENSDRALGELHYIESMTGRNELPGGENAEDYLRRQGLLWIESGESGGQSL